MYRNVFIVRGSCGFGPEWSRHYRWLDAIWAADALWRDGFRVRIATEQEEVRS